MYFKLDSIFKDVYFTLFHELILYRQDGICN